MKIALVILNWNGEALLEKFLPSITAHSGRAEIYVADNASTDGSLQFLTKHYPKIKIIKNAANYGFAKGYNEALQAVDADILALVNSDIEVTYNWLRPIIDEFKSNSNTAIIQPKILDYKRKDYFEYAGAAGGFIDKFGYPFCRGRLFDQLEKDQGQYDDNRDIFWASGACLFIRKRVFDELGGFDPRFFAHQEEIDLCWRAYNRGYLTRYIAQSVVYHVGGATLEQSNPRKTYLNFRNSLLTLIKNLPKKKIFFILFTRLLLDGAAGIRFLFLLEPLHTWAIIRAHFSFYSLFKYAYSQRDTNQRQNYFEIGSLVKKYYVQQKKTYLSLF